MTSAPLAGARDERAYDEPWQAKAAVLVDAVAAATDTPPETFRTFLIAAIGEDSDRPYWESWLVALERWLADLGYAP